MIGILEKYLSQNTELKPEDILKVSSFFELKTYKPDEVVIQADSKVNIIGFIIDGVLRASEVKQSGDCIIHYFLTENHFFSEANGLFKSLPAKLSIEAATASTIFITPIDKLHALTNEIQGLDLAIISTREKELIDIIDAQEILHKGKSNERYLAFKEKYPTIVNRIKDKDIAAYLGVSKFTLSRIKGSL